MAANMTVVTNLLNGHRVGRFANRKTLSNDETIQEAIEGGYVTGKKENIGQNAKGVLRGMIIGIQKDGNGRKINEFISLQPVIKGSLLDDTDTIDKKNLRVRVAARTLKELQPDTSAWSFTLEGTTSETLNITSITTGDELNVVEINKAIALNGFGLKDPTEVKWAVVGTTKSGTVAAAKITSEWTRITLAADVLSELASTTYNGLTLVVTVKVGAQMVTKTATLKYVA